MTLILNWPFLLRDPKKKKHTSPVPPLPPPGTAGRSSRLARSSHRLTQQRRILCSLCSLVLSDNSSRNISCYSRLLFINNLVGERERWQDPPGCGIDIGLWRIRGEGGMDIDSRAWVPVPHNLTSIFCMIFPVSHITHNVCQGFLPRLFNSISDLILR